MKYSITVLNLTFFQFTEEDGCQKPLNQIAYRTAKTTITCKNPGDEFKASVKFFCKETKTSVCEDILPTKKNGTFTLINTRDDFNLIISNLTTQHAGGYWCGVESSGRHRATIRKINLQVKGKKRTHTNYQLPVLKTVISGSHAKRSKFFIIFFKKWNTICYVRQRRMPTGFLKVAAQKSILHDYK